MWAFARDNPELHDWIEIVADILPTASQPNLTSPSIAYGRVGQPFAYQATATHSPSSFEVRNELPEGLAFNTESGWINGTPLSPGIRTVVLAAQNANGFGNPFEVTLVIQAAAGTPVISGGIAATMVNGGASIRAPQAETLAAVGRVGEMFSFTLAASESPERYLATGLPEGLAINETTGEIAGVPVRPGVFDIPVSAVNAAGEGTTAILKLTVSAAVGTPVITSALSATGQVGAAFLHTLTSSPASLGFTARNLPDGLVLDPETGVISGNPEAPGTFMVEVAGTNSIGTGDVSVLSIVIGGAAGTPVITSPAVVSGTAGEPFSFQLTATGTPDSFHVSNIPFGLAIDPATGLISGNPVSAGILTIQVWAENASGEGVSNELRFEIAAPAASPVITTPAMIEMVAGSPMSHQFAASNSPASFNHGQLPEGLAMNPLSGMLSGSVDVAGEYPIAVSANNGAGTGPQQLFVLRVHSRLSFRGWSLTHELPDGLDGPLDKPFGDGVCNLHRFAFALAPGGGDLLGLPKAVIVVGPGGQRYFAVEFTRRRNLEGVGFELRASDHVGGFSAIPAIEEFVGIIDDDRERIRMRAPEPITDRGRRFMTVAVELSP
ncbi:MAG TPA: Ig domain-containing protein [Luteolibacter sp.]|nr:Ig domain-containing protein [Luteolibacter sp.]